MYVGLVWILHIVYAFFWCRPWMVALSALGGCFVQAKKAEWLQYKKVGKKRG